MFGMLPLACANISRAYTGMQGGWARTHQEGEVDVGAGDEKGEAYEDGQRDAPGHPDQVAHTVRLVVRAH